MNPSKEDAVRRSTPLLVPVAAVLAPGMTPAEVERVMGSPLGTFRVVTAENQLFYKSWGFEDCFVVVYFAPDSGVVKSKEILRHRPRLIQQVESLWDALWPF
jgi:hypothetical protein